MLYRPGPDAVDEPDHSAPSSRSRDRPTAVDHRRAADDEARHVRRQVQDRHRDLARLAEPPSGVRSSMPRSVATSFLSGSTSRSMSPGTTRLTRTPRPAHSTAGVRVSATTPAWRRCRRPCGGGSRCPRSTRRSRCGQIRVRHRRPAARQQAQTPRGSTAMTRSLRSGRSSLGVHSWCPRVATRPRAGRSRRRSA